MRRLVGLLRARSSRCAMGPSVAVLALVLAEAPQCLSAGSYLHPRLSSGEKIIRTVALVPPTAQMTAEGAFRNDIKEKEAEPLSAATAIVVSNALKKRGWEISDSAFTNQALQGKEELKYLVGYIRARHQTLVRTINGKDVSKGSYSLGDRVVGMRAQAPVDALVLVHADGHRLTKAAWVVSVAVWGALSGLTGASLEAMFNLLEKHVSLQISLVDSSTGEVLWYSEVSRAGEKQILKELRKVP